MGFPAAELSKAMPAHEVAEEFATHTNPSRELQETNIEDKHRHTTKSDTFSKPKADPAVRSGGKNTSKTNPNMQPKFIKSDTFSKPKADPAVRSGGKNTSKTN